MRGHGDFLGAEITETSLVGFTVIASCRIASGIIPETADRTPRAVAAPWFAVTAIRNRSTAETVTSDSRRPPNPGDEGAPQHRIPGPGRRGEVEAMVADADDLREAMGLEQWDVTSRYGTQSRLLVDAMSKHPDTLGTTYLDSPWPTNLDELTGGALLTRATLKRTLRACEEDARCRGDRPLDTEWQQAMRRLAAEPLQGTYRGHDGRLVEVLVDDGKLLRAARYAVMRAAAHGDLHPRLAEIIGADPGLCVGFRPLCSGQDDISWGVYLTHMCRDALPSIDRDALTEATGGDPTYEAVFDPAPWGEVCYAWTVAPAESSPAAWPSPSQVPVLLMPGRTTRSPTCNGHVGLLTGTTRCS